MEKLALVLRRIFDDTLDDLQDDVPFAELDAWDSLKYMRLVLALESEYGIELGPDEIQAMTSLGGIKRTLDARGLLLREG